MSTIYYIDRQTRRQVTEDVLSGSAIELFYSDSWYSKTIKYLFQPLLTRSAIFSQFYGYLQKCSFSRKKIIPFIERFRIDPTEFAQPVESFASFNDFFIRHLKPISRPIYEGPTQAIIPADGRYYFFPSITSQTVFPIKNQTLDLKTLLQSETLAKKYEGGPLVLARLAPPDYHRFHFPIDCVVGETALIRGALDSVNPIALRQRLAILAENKRTLTPLYTQDYGTVLSIEVGALAVGTIRQTAKPNKSYQKGDEKGYFEFGGSTLILLFEPGTIQFDADLLESLHTGCEIRCLMGQSMGKLTPICSAKLSSL